jgi:hypothetical protein
MRHQRTTSERSEAVSQEFFRSRLDALIDLAPPRPRSISRMMPWEAIENAVSGFSARAGGVRASRAADPVDGRAFVSVSRT